RASLDQVAHVTRASGDARQPRPLVEPALDLVDRYVLALDELPDQSGVEISRPRAHHEPFERREAHRRIDRAAVLDGRSRGAVAEVKRDERRGRLLHARELAEARYHELVGNPVKPEAPEPVTLG